MSDPLHRKRKPLAGSALSPSAFGQDLTAPAPPSALPLPPGVNPRIAGQLQQAQSAANEANNQRYTQGLGVLTGGLGATQQSITNAIQSSQNYGQSDIHKLDLQYQQALGKQDQSAIGRGLENTTIADTMKDLPTRQHNDAVANVNEMASQRMSQLYQQQANANAQGSNNIASYIASRNDAGPDMSSYTKLASQAAAAPRQRTISGGGGSMPAYNGQGQGGGGSPTPPSPSGGGGGSSGGSSGSISMGGGEGPQASTQGYTGSISAAMGGGASPSSGPSQVMSNAGYAPGSISIAPSGGAPAAKPGVSSPAPSSAPASVAAAAPSTSSTPTAAAQAPSEHSFWNVGNVKYASVNGKTYKWDGNNWNPA